MISYINTKNSAYGVQTLVADDTADIKNLPNNIAMGSTCLILSTGRIYRINSQGKWLLQPTNAKENLSILDDNGNEYHLLVRNGKIGFEEV